MIFLFLTFAALAAALFGYFVWRKSAPALVVLAYEKAGTPPKSSRLKNEWVSAAQFEKDLNRLLARGFTPVPLRALQTPQNLPKKPVLLAFLGGYQSFFTQIFPLLSAKKVPCALFLAPDCVSTYNRWNDPFQEPWQNVLTEKELSALAKSGLISFGALALSSADVTTEPDENQARYLVQESLHRLPSQLGLTPEGFALWPAKNWDEKKAAPYLDGSLNLPIITPRCGVNPKAGAHFLKVLQPTKHPLATRYTLFKLR